MKEHAVTPAPPPHPLYCLSMHPKLGLNLRSSCSTLPGSRIIGLGYRFSWHHGFERRSRYSLPCRREQTFSDWRLYPTAVSAHRRPQACVLTGHWRGSFHHHQAGGERAGSWHPCTSSAPASNISSLVTLSRFLTLCFLHFLTHRHWAPPSIWSWV